MAGQSHSYQHKVTATVMTRGKRRPLHDSVSTDKNKVIVPPTKPQISLPADMHDWLRHTFEKRLKSSMTGLPLLLSAPNPEQIPTSLNFPQNYPTSAQLLKVLSNSLSLTGPVSSRATSAPLTTVTTARLFNYRRVSSGLCQRTWTTNKKGWLRFWVGSW